jgi:hypothetical protein
MPHSRAHSCLFATWSQITQKSSDMEMCLEIGTLITTKLRLQILVALLLIYVVFDRINNNKTQMQTAVKAHTSVTTIFPFDIFFLNSPQKYPVQNEASDVLFR